MSDASVEARIGAGPVLSEALLRRFDAPGPRYTSYPTADRFVEAFGAADTCRALSQRAQGAMAGASAPLSVYVHIPFCESVCYYCACNKVITKHHERAAEYLDALELEIGLVRAELGAAQQVSQLHFGGGSPTFLSDAELERVMASLRGAFRHRRQHRDVDRDRPAHRHAAAPGLLPQPGLQPHQFRRAGLRPPGAAGRAPRAALRQRARI